MAAVATDSTMSQILKPEELSSGTTPLNGEVTGAQVEPSCASAEEHVATKKRQAENGADHVGETIKKLKSEGESGQCPLSILKKQIEYYFSDENMQYDKFFHPKISAHPEGWLDAQHLLSCKKVQALKATQDDIVSALKDSALETKVDEHGKAWVRRLTPLPPLEQRPERNPSTTGRHGRNQRGDKNSKYSPSVPRRVDDIHSLGCFVKITQIPQEASWVPVKEALVQAIPEHGKIRHVSSVSSDGTAYAYFRKFDNDVEFFQTTCSSISVNNMNVKVELVNDIALTAQIIDKHLPPKMVKEREREVAKIKAQDNTKRITVGGTEFQSVDHLRKCYQELLSVTEPETLLKPNAYNIIRAMLEFHPNAAEKARDITGIKVACRTDIDTSKEKNKSNQPIKCFFVVRSDGTCEDFSMAKCLTELLKRRHTLSSTAPVSGALTAEATSESSAPVDTEPTKPTLTTEEVCETLEAQGSGAHEEVPPRTPEVQPSP